MRARKELLLVDATLSQAERAMARLAAIVESSDDAIIGKTLDGVVETWNGGAERIYGFAASEIVGRPISILVPPDRPDDLPQILERIGRGERVEHYVTVRMRKDGTAVDVSLTVSPIRDAEGDIIGASTIARDVTERTRIEQERVRLLLQLQVQNERLQAQAEEIQAKNEELFAANAELSQMYEGQARLAAIVESSDDAIIGKTLDGVILTWNAGAGRLYGYSSEEALGKNISLLVPPGRADELPEILERLARGERVEHYETTRARKNGSMLDVSITASPIRDVDGNIIGASTIARDVTYRKRIEQQLADAHYQLAEAHQQLQAQYAQLEERVAVRTADLTMTNKHLKQEIEQRQRAERWLEQKNIELSSAKLAKERFLSAMSHEFRRALNAVIGFNDALTMLPGPFTVRQEEQLRTIRRNAQLLPSVVSDLLDLAEIESGTLQIRTEPVDLRIVAREVTGLLRPIAEQKGLKFIDNIPDEQIILRTDRRVLRRILLDLTNYVISFTEMGAVRIEYARGQEAGETVTEISVVGTGSSIREEHQRKVAEAFRQLDITVPRSPEDAGLGLPVSQKLAQMVGGKISLTSVYGRGSTFTLTLV